MIKKFNEYKLNESANDFSKGDVIEVVSMFGQIEDLPEETAKYIGRIYIVDSYDSEFGKITTLGGGTWITRDVRKLSPVEIKKRAQEIRYILNAWETKKSKYKENSLKYIKQKLKGIQNNLDYIDDTLTLTEDVGKDGKRYRLTLKIEKVN